MCNSAVSELPRKYKVALAVKITQLYCKFVIESKYTYPNTYLEYSYLGNSWRTTVMHVSIPTQ